MTVAEVCIKAMEGRITWLQAADICGLSARQLRRLRLRYEKLGLEGFRVGRAGKHQPRRIPAEVEAEVCRLRRKEYEDFTVQHFLEMLREKHDFTYGYTWLLTMLQRNGLAERHTTPGSYRRKRERRPMTGMLLHLDASRHAWLGQSQPMWDLNVLLDDADGRILHGLFVPEEGVRSTQLALRDVLVRHGRFCELYTDRGSHFCTTTKAEHGPDDVQNGTVSRALALLGIHHILARTPQARGRSERCFGTIQGRLPQELSLDGITSYEAGNRYLQERFMPAFNGRFTVTPREPESAFTRLDVREIDMALSERFSRKVRADNTVEFQKMELQLGRGAIRQHFARCPVTVHRMVDDTLLITHDGTVIGRYTADGATINDPNHERPKT